ncbi:MAG: hypothetical protein LC797_02510 [Chloroflexi bacterium]|nr:hypothetical protein [Chloroflexota bacterium]
MSFLGRLFGGGSRAASRASGIYVRVKCDACGEVVQTRINPSSELSQSDGGGYFVRKVLVGQQCFRPIEVELHYADLSGTEVSREIHGGTSAE